MEVENLRLKIGNCKSKNVSGFTPHQVKNWIAGKQEPSRKAALPLSSLSRLVSAEPGAGFTLVEMLISFTLFAIIMTVATSVFITVSKNYGFFGGYLNSLGNLRFVLEKSSREIKEGYAYEKTGFASFAFKDKDGNAVSYYLASDKRIHRNSQGVDLAITDERLKVNSFKIQLHCPSAANCEPMVTFILNLEPQGVGAGTALSSFTLQFTITQRRLAV